MPMYTQEACAGVAKNAKFAGVQSKYDNCYGECLKTSGGSYTWDGTLTDPSTGETSMIGPGKYWIAARLLKGFDEDTGLGHAFMVEGGAIEAAGPTAYSFEVISDPEEAATKRTLNEDAESVGKAKAVGPTGPWSCSVCTYNNDAGAKSCAMCGSAWVG